MRISCRRWVPSTLVALDRRLDTAAWKNAPFTVSLLRLVSLSRQKSASRTLESKRPSRARNRQGTFDLEVIGRCLAVA